MQNTETVETVDVVVEQYEWRNVLGCVDHKRCLTDDGRVLEVYRQPEESAEGLFSFVWRIYTLPGFPSTYWGRASSLLEATSKAEGWAWATDRS